MKKVRRKSTSEMLGSGQETRDEHVVNIIDLLTQTMTFGIRAQVIKRFIYIFELKETRLSSCLKSKFGFGRPHYISLPSEASDWL